MDTQSLTPDDEKVRRRIRRTAVLLALVAASFFAAFIMLTAMRG